MLDGSTVYSSLDFTFGYNHIALSLEAQKKPALLIPTVKFEFKTEPFGLAQTPIHFQQIKIFIHMQSVNI